MKAPTFCVAILGSPWIHYDPEAIFTVQFLTDFSWFLLCRIEKHYVITPQNWFLNALSTLLPVLWQLKSEVALGGRWKPRSKTVHIAHQDQVATRVEHFWQWNSQMSYILWREISFCTHIPLILDLIKVLKFWIQYKLQIWPQKDCNLATLNVYRYLNLQFYYIYRSKYLLPQISSLLLWDWNSNICFGTCFLSFY